MVDWRSFTGFNLALDRQRFRARVQTITLFRLLVSYLGLLLVIFNPNWHNYTLPALIIISLYSTLLFASTAIRDWFYRTTLLPVLVDEILILLVCCFSGGLDSPFILAFLLPVLVYATNPSLREYLAVTAMSIFFILLLSVWSKFGSNIYLYLCLTILVSGFYVNVLVRNELIILSAFAARDGLTGLYTHRFFYDHLNLLISQDSSSDTGFSLIMIDLDGFKRLNDKLGHQQGDRILKKVADTIKLNVRDSDVVARYGGDEFAILLPGIDYQLCQSIVNRLRQAIIELGYFTDVSIGSAQYPDEATEPEKLVNLADRRMYAQKGTRIDLAPTADYR